MELKKTARVNIRISEEIKQWFMQLSQDTGISMSSLMAMALKEYIDQKTTIKAMSDINTIIAKIESINK